MRLLSGSTMAHLLQQRFFFFLHREDPTLQRDLLHFNL